MRSEPVRTRDPGLPHAPARTQQTGTKPQTGRRHNQQPDLKTPERSRLVGRYLHATRESQRTQVSRTGHRCSHGGKDHGFSLSPTAE